ncbi:MAG: hypothetical protein ACHQAQ_20060 [Hyphomicrobiales bacterium]
MLFLIGLLLMAAAGLFFWAGHNLDHGVHWAEELCRQAPILCASPYWLLLGGGAVMSLALISKAFKA